MNFFVVTNPETERDLLCVRVGERLIPLTQPALERLALSRDPETMPAAPPPQPV